MNKKHILITGAAGFIGSHLVDKFLAAGYLVTGIDNLVTGQLKNLASAFEDSNFEFIKTDICSPIHENFFIKNYGLHGILHFASPASPVDFSKIPVEILRTNSIGTINAVDLALKYSARFILASTSEIYGDPLEHPQRETYWGNVNPVGPRSMYDESKRFAEAYVWTNKNYNNLNASIIRIFNTYGPRMRINDGRIVPQFISEIIEHKPLSIVGNGNQTRSFCYVDDLIHGVYLLFKSDHNEIINLGNPEEISVLDFAKTLHYISSTTNPSFVFLPARIDEPQKRKPDIEKAKNLLNWIPETELKNGLIETLNFFKSQFLNF